MSRFTALTLVASTKAGRPSLLLRFEVFFLKRWLAQALYRLILVPAPASLKRFAPDRLVFSFGLFRPPQPSLERGLNIPTICRPSHLGW